MLALIMVITVVTPFELTFLHPPDSWGRGFAGGDAPGVVFVFYLNRVSDACFLVDMSLCRSFVFEAPYLVLIAVVRARFL